MKPKKIEMSFCTFNDGKFDIMVRDKDTGKEVVFSGEKTLSEEELEMVLEIAPACVWTPYTQDVN